MHSDQRDWYTGDAAASTSTTARLVVREVDLRTELGTLIAVFNRGFDASIPRSRFDWLYWQNPDGASTAWFVHDDRTGEIVGCTAVFPRRIHVSSLNEHLVAWNCGDFCILPGHRSGSAAIALRRAARLAVDIGASPFLYAHPNARMLHIHRRVGHKPIGQMIRLARPIRPRGNRLGARIAGAALRVLRPEWIRLLKDDYVIESRVLPPEIDDLFERRRSVMGTALVRDRRYLEWRFLNCPTDQYRFILSTRRGLLSGYLVFCVVSDQLIVKDWLGADGRAVQTLFTAAINEAFAAEVASLSVTMLESHSDMNSIRALGFGLRPKPYSAVAYAPEWSPWRANVLSADAWYMTAGDRDV